MVGASTGENIFNLINTVLQEHSEWRNCIAFSSDNANVMMGRKKGVAGFLKEQSDIFITGCTCHLIHLTASKAAAVIKEVKIQDIFVDIYYYMDKSSKRTKLFQELQKEFGNETLRILKPCATRWLVIGFIHRSTVGTVGPTVSFLRPRNCRHKRQEASPARFAR